MNETIYFNHQVNKLLKIKFQNNKWSGTSPTFYKKDVPNIIKQIEIRKLVKQDLFSCHLKIISNFSLSNSIKNKNMQTFREIFVVGLTPNKITDKAYNWSYSGNNDFKHNQLDLLWEAIATHGKTFFDKFNNFPEPFLEIKPEYFNKKMVKLFNEYEVYNQVDFMNFLKEIHQSLNDNKTAAKFSELAIELFIKNIENKKIVNDKIYKLYLNSLGLAKT